MSAPWWLRMHKAPVRLAWHVIPADEYGAPILVAQSIDHGTGVSGLIGFPEDWKPDYTLDVCGMRHDGYELEVQATRFDIPTLAEAVQALQAAVAPLWAEDRYPADEQVPA